MRSSDLGHLHLSVWIAMVCVNDLNNTYVPYSSQPLETLKLGSQQKSDKRATVRKGSTM